jgi:hypothetical protein
MLFANPLINATFWEGYIRDVAASSAAVISNVINVL